MKNNIYLDQAATSFPKAPGVAEAITYYLTQVGATLGRSTASAATEAEMLAFGLRGKLCALFESKHPEACIFTPGATYGLNLVLAGYLQPGDHVLVSSMEHNAVMRPLDSLRGIMIEKVPCAADGSMLAGDVATKIRTNTRLVCMTHASNVCGTLLPLEQIGALCHEQRIAFVVDAAQTAGHIPLGLESLHADAIVLPAHKGLLGPQGFGAVMMQPAFARRLHPLITGGTGSHSSLETQPSELPDKFEAGTPNIPGIYGLDAALHYLMPRMNALHEQAMRLCAQLLEGLQTLPHARVLGKSSLEGRLPVIAIDFEGFDNAAVADMLDRQFGIATRCGLHCAPSAHHTLGSYPQGAVRFSIAASNTAEQIDITLQALRAIVTAQKRFFQH